MNAKDLQYETFALLRKRGFKPARTLPLPDLKQSLRPTAEIAGRLAALDGLFKWVSAPESVLPTARVKAYLKDNGLLDWLTEEEAAVVALPRKRAHEEHVDTIGWKLENMWPLAWVLGHPDEPALEPPFMDYGRVVEFLAPVEEAGVAAWAQKAAVRPADEVIRLEYRFYCAHNAVRSAQLGGETVPDGFDPVANGGAVHERRHALSWCLSPGVDWDDTDLST